MTPEQLERYYELQSFFTGDESLTGPEMDLCRRILGAEWHSFHDKAATLSKYTLRNLPNVKIKALDNQINGALWMCLQAFGNIPTNDEDLKLRLKPLEQVPRRGGFLIDSTGLGKTFTSLLFISFFITHCRNQMADHRPIVVVAPAGIVIEQWRTAIKDLFKDITLIVGYGDTPINAAQRKHWLSSQMMRKAPHDLSAFPQHLRYIFDKKDEKASRTVILTSYDTLAKRTLDQIAPEEEGDPVVWLSHWDDVFGMAFLDEGHRLRHPYTKVHQAVAQIRARMNFIITGTPVQNNSLVSLATLLSMVYSRVLTQPT